MRILHTEWSDGFGGQEHRVLAEALGLSKRGHYVAIVCRNHARIKTEAIKLGIDVHTLPLRKLYDIVSVMRLTKFLKDSSFDIVNTHSGVDSWIGGLAARFAGTPLLVRSRHLNIPLKRNPLNFIHYLPDIYIADGGNMRDTLVNVSGFPANKIVSIPTGVCNRFFEVRKNKEAKLKYGLDIDSIIISNVGILRSVKGHEVTLKAVKGVIESVPNAKFLIIGDGPLEEALKNMADTLGISDHVLFTGYIENIPGIYSFTDVAVQSSWSEGIPFSIIQAMAAGVPVIATKVGGVPEIITHKKTGILIEPGDHEALGREIVHLLNDSPLMSGMIENAKIYVSKEYSVNQMFDKIELLYKKLLEEKNR